MELIERCRGGDSEAFRELFEQYKNLVYRTAYLMLGDPQDAEDVLQEVFLGLFRSLDSYQAEKSAFSTWLHRVTINRCLNHRRGANLLALLQEALGFLSPGPSASPEGIDGQLSVRAGLRRLSTPLRAVIVLRYYHDLSYAEIAQILDISEGTVKSRLHLAHKKLRALFQAGFLDAVQTPEVKDELPTHS